MKILINSKNEILVKDFPMSVFDIQDTLDMLGVPHDRNITFMFFKSGNSKLPSMLFNRRYTADIYKLNLFAERIEKLNNMEMTAFKSLLTADPDSSFDDMLLMTYGLDCVPVWPCSDLAELGEAMIENDMVEELNELPDELIDLVDREKIGRLCQEREGGVFVDSYYCVPSSYEPPDIHIEIGRPENCFFRLLIAPEEEKIEQAQWVSLPCEGEIFSEIYNGICLDVQSALPNLKFDDTHKIGTLNELAKQISQLSHDDFVKLKAVMESGNICEISDTLNCIGRLDEYQFDRNIFDHNDFGRAYLTKNLPADFDSAIFENADLFDFGQEVLMHKHGEITSYGAISGRSQELYSPITVQREQTQTEENTEDICKDFSEEEPEEDESEDFEMGGMSM